MRAIATDPDRFSEIVSSSGQPQEKPSQAEKSPKELLVELTDLYMAP